MRLKIRQGPESTDQKTSKLQGYLAPHLIGVRAHSNNDLDTADLGSGGRHRDPTDHHILARDVLQCAACFAEKMVMVVDVGIEIGASWLDHDFAQQAGSRKLMEDIVNRRKRYRD